MTFIPGVKHEFTKAVEEAYTPLIDQILGVPSKLWLVQPINIKILCIQKYLTKSFLCSETILEGILASTKK